MGLGLTVAAAVVEVRAVVVVDAVVVAVVVAVARSGSTDCAVGGVGGEGSWEGDPLLLPHGLAMKCAHHPCWLLQLCLLMLLQQA